MKLLIAEDDLTSRTMLEVVAHKWGYETIAVEDGESAWQIMLQDDHPELLLLDWEMPKLSGVELCSRIRKQEVGDPAFIILLTSRSSTQDIVTGLEAGANDYISKPFENAELHARLEVGRRMLNLQAERRKTEKEKERLQRELEQTHKMEALGQMTGSIAHDFNNILGITLGYTSIALQRYGNEIPEKMKYYLDTALSASERAKELVAKMLTYTHGDNQKTEPIDLVAEVENSITRLQENISEDIQIEFNSEDNLPDILLDPMSLQQLLRILSDNAMDAMDNRGLIRIDVGWCRGLKSECIKCHKVLEGDWIELAVTDTGAGMTKETIAHIFEPFYTTKEFGKGMGMAMLHGILGRVDGHCLIESTLGNGSKIRLFFPPIL